VKRAYWLVAVGAASAGLLVLQACSGDNNETDGGTDASNDTTAPDVSKQDVTSNDAPNDVNTNDASDAGDGACPGSWMIVPDAGLYPDGGLPPLLIHAAASGTQNYVCTASVSALDAGGDGSTSYSWLFVGPQANLDDCNAQLIGHHFASEAGATAPEWQTLDNSYVIAAKQQAITPDASAVPWLLLKETSNGGTGTIAKTQYIQRLYTTGGIAPTTTCDGNNVEAGSNVPYTADYYFYGQ
jgi:hypothetical protein